MNCLNMHHPVSSLAPVCLKLLATHPARTGHLAWSPHCRRSNSSDVRAAGCSRAPLAVATDRWQLSGMSSWAQPDILTMMISGNFGMLVFAACLWKLLRKTGARPRASGKLCCHDSLTCQVKSYPLSSNGFAFLLFRADSTGKHLPGNRSLSFQTWRHLPSCKQNGSCCRGTLSENMHAHIYQTLRLLGDQNSLQWCDILQESMR